MTTILTKDLPDFSVAFTVDGNMILTRNEKIDVAGLSINQIGAMLASGYESEIVSPNRLIDWAQECCDAREDDIKRLSNKEIAQVYCFRFLVADGDGWVSQDEFVKKAKVGTRFLINCTKEFTITEIFPSGEVFTLVDTFCNKFYLYTMDGVFPFAILRTQTGVVDHPNPHVIFKRLGSYPSISICS